MVFYGLIFMSFMFVGLVVFFAVAIMVVGSIVYGFNSLFQRWKLNVYQYACLIAAGFLVAGLFYFDMAQKKEELINLRVKPQIHFVPASFEG